MHHAFAIEAPSGAGIAAARAWIANYLGLAGSDNPDVIELTYGLFSVEDARRVWEIAAVAPIGGESKAIIIAASRAYREAQNALLKLFEEPPPGTYLFLILPSLGVLVPTLRSRIQTMALRQSLRQEEGVSEAAKQFLTATREKRSAIVKKLAAGKDEEERRQHRDDALAIVNGIEAAASNAGAKRHAPLLREISVFRAYLHERAAPVRMILEHLAIVTPHNLL